MCRTHKYKNSVAVLPVAELFLLNSYRRAKLNNRTPIEAFAFYHGTEVLNLLGCKLIEPNCVILTPKLLKR